MSNIARYTAKVIASTLGLKPSQVPRLRLVIRAAIDEATRLPTKGWAKRHHIYRDKI